MNAQRQGPSAPMLKNLMRLNVNVYVLISQTDAPTLRFSIMILANAIALISSDALVDRSLIQIHANVSVLSQGLDVWMLKYSMMLHASVSAWINQQGVLTLRFLIMISANVAAPEYSGVLEDRDLIQTHVNVSVLNQGHSVLMLRNSTMWHASVSAQIDQQDVHTPRFLMKNFANVCVLTFISVLEASSLI